MLVAFGTPAPGNVPGFVLAFVLAAASIYAIGLLIDQAAMKPTPSSPGVWQG